MVVCICNPRAGEVEEGESPKLADQTLTDLRPSERPSLKIKVLGT